LAGEQHRVIRSIFLARVGSWRMLRRGIACCLLAVGASPQSEREVLARLLRDDPFTLLRSIGTAAEADAAEAGQETPMLRSVTP